MNNRPEEILGLPANPSRDEVKSRYRALAKRYHPDVNPGDPTAEWVFKQISAAQRTLEKRQTNGRRETESPGREDGAERRSRSGGAEETGRRGERRQKPAAEGAGRRRRDTPRGRSMAERGMARDRRLGENTPSNESMRMAIGCGRRMRRSGDDDVPGRKHPDGRRHGGRDRDRTHVAGVVRPRVRRLATRGEQDGKPTAHANNGRERNQEAR